MKKKLIVPYSASELDDLLDQMDLSGEGEEGTDDGDESGAEEDYVDEDGEDGDEGDESNNEPPKNQRTQQQITNDGFAKLRIANRELTNLLGKLATASGIEYRNTQELITKLNDSALEQIANKSKVPVELLREIEALRNDSALLKQQNTQTRLEQGFKTLLDDYGLDEKQLRSFCAELDNSGVDVSQAGFDIVNYYKTTHIDDIIEARVQKAVAAALNQNSETQTHSTAPMRKRGGSGNGGAKINTVSALDALLSGYPEK